MRRRHARKVKRILVTGGAGFIGSHLCERLLAEGHRVIAVDNLITGSLGNIAALRRYPAFSFERRDITEPIAVASDEIYNLACPASPVQYQRHPLETLRASTRGVENMLEAARGSGARFLQASTSEVYGDPLAHPQREEYWGNVNPLGERSCYDEGKRAAESLVMAYRRVHGVDARIARIFNTYGPRMASDDGRVISNFIAQALANRPLTLYGDGSQTRSFCFVSDMVAGLICMMERAEAAGPVNLGNPEERAIADIARLVIELAGSRSRIVRSRLPSDDPKRRCPDISLAKKLLCWSPRVGLKEGLARTIAHFRTERGENRARGTRKHP